MIVASWNHLADFLDLRVLSIILVILTNTGGRVLDKTLWRNETLDFVFVRNGSYYAILTSLVELRNSRHAFSSYVKGPGVQIQARSARGPARRRAVH